MPLNLKAPMPHTSTGSRFVGKGFPLLRVGVHTGRCFPPAASTAAGHTEPYSASVSFSSCWKLGSMESLDPSRPLLTACNEHIDTTPQWDHSWDGFPLAESFFAKQAFASRLQQAQLLVVTKVHNNDNNQNACQG